MTIRPEVTVLDMNDDDIDEKFYNVTYKGCKDVGLATIEITFAGYYSGVVEKTFTIIPKNNLKLKLKNKSTGIDVSWKVTDKKISGYEIQMSTSKKFSSVKKALKIKGYKTKSKLFTKLKAKTTYYFRIRTYKTVNSKDYYSDWSAISKLKRNK